MTGVQTCALPICSSQDFPYGCFTAVNSTTKQATIITPSGYTAIYWPPDVLGQSIQFQYDGYVGTYLITAVSNAVITFADASNESLTASSTAWQIIGAKNAQGVTITSVDFHFNYLGQNTQAYGGSTSSGNVGNMGGNPS